MTAAQVLTEYDDGRWYVADVLDQYRDRVDGSWRVVVTYSTEPGSRYIRARAELTSAGMWPASRVGAPGHPHLVPVTLAPTNHPV